MRGVVVDDGDSKINYQLSLSRMMSFIQRVVGGGVEREYGGFVKLKLREPG